MCLKCGNKIHKPLPSKPSNKIQFNKANMSNYKTPFRTSCTKSATIFSPPFLPIDTTSTSPNTRFNDLRKAEDFLSSCCNTKTERPDVVYNASKCSCGYCSVTDQSEVKSIKSWLNPTSPRCAKGDCFSPTEKVATSGGNSISWRSDKKKKTISAGLLIALGVAGVVVG